MTKARICLLLVVVCAIVLGGVLTDAMAQEKKARPAPQDRLKQLDKDGDGALTFDEFKGKRKQEAAIERAEQTFKRLDKNGDKRLSADELKVLIRPDAQRIKGTWKVVSKNGEEDTDEKGNLAKFADGKLTFVVEGAESFEMKYELDPKKKPKALDLAGEVYGEKFLMKAVYLLQGRKLTICASDSPDGPRPTKIEAKEGEQNVYVLERVRPQQKKKKKESS